MHKPRIHYFEQEDILHLVVSEEEASNIKLGSNITAELNAKGKLIGVEIPNATIFLRDSIMESVQFKIL